MSGRVTAAATAAGSAGGHIPALYREVLAGLAPQPGGAYIDATVGLGGHAVGILELSAPDGRLLGLDADPAALDRARVVLAPFAGRAVLASGWHRDLADLARPRGFEGVQGILFDLGVSSMQLDEPRRGFSFAADGPLDMRMGPGRPTAAELVNTLAEDDLAQIIFDYGEERHARRIARAILRARPLHTTGELAALVSAIVAARGPRSRIHPATRTFQALRIAVNDELASLAAALPQAVGLLAPGGRLAVISFHSLEDRIVKRFLRQEAQDCICPPRLPQCVCGHRASVRLLTGRPIRPTDDEVLANPRSRSARLRIAERLPERPSPTRQEQGSSAATSSR